jgi:cell division protein FtsI/penicillin-binding protein 2
VTQLTETIPVWKVFAKSSNVGMLKIIDDNYAKKGKIDRFLKQLNTIGIGEISGVDIFGENKPFINNPDHQALGIFFTRYDSSRL